MLTDKFFTKIRHQWRWLLLICFLAAFVFLFYFAANQLTSFSQSLDDQLKTTDGRTNILFLGIPGGNHQGSDLTDTLIFFSFNQQSGDSLMLSLPRDIWVASMRAKLNTAYHYGEKEEPGAGFDFIRTAVKEILNQPIHYVFLLDFKGFEQMIDALGGLEVEVKNVFDDYQYPIAGKEDDDCDGDPEYQCRYGHVHFDAGRQLMSGERALQYVRSRYAEGEEGSDFARSWRQQQVILAFQKRLFSWQTISQIDKAKVFIEIFNQSVKTDIQPEIYPALVKLFLNFDSQKMRTEVLDFLITPARSALYDYHWVLIPQNDWSEIHAYIECLTHTPWRCPR